MNGSVLQHRAVRWSVWFAVLAALTIAMLSVRAQLDKAHVALAFLLVVLGASATGGRTLGLTIAMAAFVTFNVGFLLPYGTLVIANPLDWLVLVAFLVTSAVATQLLFRARSETIVATERAAEVERLAILGAETLNAANAEAALNAIARVIREATDVDRCEVYRRRDDGTIARVAFAPRDAEHSHDDMIAPESVLGWLEETRRSAVQLADGTLRLAFDADVEAAHGSEQHVHGTPADGAQPHDTQLHGTQLHVPGTRDARPANRSGLDNLRTVIGQALTEPARALLLPLLVRGSTVGLLRIASDGRLALSPEQARLLEALAYYAALGVERSRLVEHAERAESERRVEGLRNALLTAVSHDLRTPLTTIKAIAHELSIDTPGSRAVVIEAEADRLAALIDDLLNLSRIHAGAVVPNLAINTIDELVAVALQQVSGVIGADRIEVTLPDSVLPACFDFTATLRALVNLLENAAKYAPGAEPILLRAHRDGEQVLVRVLDRGPGVAEADRAHIFEPFYRPRATPPDIRGSGLGLSIAKGLAEAQGGTVYWSPRPGGGSEFVLTIPAVDVPAVTTL